MNASASGSSTPLVGGGAPGHHSDHSHGSGLDVAAYVGSGDGAYSSGSDGLEREIQISLGAEQIIPFAGEVRGISRLAINLGGGDEYNYFGIYVGGGDVQFRSGSLPDLAVEDSWMVDAGLVYRRYFTKPKTFISPYVTAGLYCQALVWQYRTPVIVGSDVIHGDSVGGGGGFIGLGTSIERGKWLSIFGEVRVGQTAFVNETSEGFLNNVLDNYGYLSFAAGLSFKF